MAERAAAWMAAGRPADDEFPGLNPRYVALVPEADVVEALTRQPDELRDLLAPVSGGAERFRYAEGKWTIRELVGHVIDTERVFGYRAFTIGRADPAPLPGFDENEYAARAGSGERPLAELLDEFATVRRSNLFVLRRFDEPAWRAVGTANDRKVSVRALAYAMVGHVRHHMDILSTRYLPSR